MNNYKEEFIRIYKSNIHREGSEELLLYLERSDFFEAPASTRFHLACGGGLCIHSLNIYERLLELMSMKQIGMYALVRMPNMPGQRNLLLSRRCCTTCAR